MASVHPYKRTAIAELHRLADQGVAYVKWLPPYQKIDPAEPLIVPYYRAMAARGMMLLTHTGAEHTFRVERDVDQDLGDPSRLALPVETGVTVVMLHAARHGRQRRPEPGQSERRRYFDRLFEMMRRYPENLYTEISVVPYLGSHRNLEPLLAEPGIRCRLLDGSDYPIPAIAAFKPTRQLLRDGYLRWPEDRDGTMAARRRAALDEIHGYNRLLFDFVMKRTIRIEGEPIPAHVFHGLDNRPEGSDCPPQTAANAARDSRR